MLDEIDAPLDEANIGRFTNVLRTMVDKSQFIVITHNKRTMEASDALYGVTMEELGVSKIVSVRFNRGNCPEDRGRGNGSRIGNYAVPVVFFTAFLFLYLCTVYSTAK